MDPHNVRSLVTFSADLLENVMLIAASTELRAGWGKEGYTISFGKREVAGRNEIEAYRKFFYAVLVQDLIHSPQEYEAAAAAEFEKEEGEIREKINELTKGGLSDFAKKVQAFREERGVLVIRAMHKVMTAQKKPENVNELIVALCRETGLDDLDYTDAVLAVAEYRKLVKYQSSASVSTMEGPKDASQAS